MAQKRLDLLVRLQDCLDSQACRELEELERHRQVDSAEESERPIEIPRKSPLAHYIPRKEKGAATSEEVHEALSVIDSSILDLAKSTK